METAMIVVDNLCKSYKQIHAVRGLSFTVPKGELFGLLGPNGAGKTTTLSMLTTLIRPTSGRIVINDLDASQHGKAIKAKIGFVPQELAVYPSLSAYDNLLFFGRIYGLRHPKLHHRIFEVLNLVNLGDRAKDNVNTFSGGMKRRLNIAAGLLHEPSILFMDEPTVGVDPQSRNAIFDSIQRLNDLGLTIIYTTHYMEEAQRLCHRVAIIDQGEIIALDSPQALISTMGRGMIELSIPTEDDSKLLPPLQKIVGIDSLVHQEGRFSIEARTTSEVLSQILDITKQHEVRVNSLRVVEPTLETVFLRLTGRALRD